MLIIVEAIPPYCGGAEQVAWMHAYALAEKDDVSIISFSDYVGQETLENIKIYFLQRKRNQLLYYFTVGREQLNRYIDGIKPDVIHSHMPNVLHFCLNKKNIPLITTIHDGVPENKSRELCQLSFYTWIKNKIIRKWNIRKSDYVTCVSRHNYELMTGLYRYKKEKFGVIPNPIYDQYLAAVQDTKGKYILNFGRQIDLKMGPLIEAARLMPDIDFKFLGSGPMVKDYNLKNIEFLGFMPDFVDIIDRALLCVFPSQSENFPLVGLEAMARGKPVITTKMGFSEYIVHKENGYLLEDRKPVTIQKAIFELLQDEGLFKRISVKARETAEKYSSHAIAQKYIDLYKQILSI